jgi:gliding-associated putative ABC transporter substrate-binding component GldG
MMELKKQRIGVSTAELVIVILIIAAVNYLSYRFFARLDMTENKQFTISKATKNVLKSLGDPVTAEFYLSSALPPQMISVRDEVKDKLQEYAAFSGGKFKLRYIDPGNDQAKKEKATSKGVQETQVQVVEKDQLSVKKVFFGLVLSYADRTEAIPMIADPQSLEYDITSRLVKLTAEHKPKVGIFIGPMTFNQQQAPSYGALQNMLGGPDGMYETVTVNPQSDTQLPDGLDGLIVMGAFNMPDSMKYSLDQFLMKGGQAIIALDPMMRAGNQPGLDQAYPALPTIEDQLQAYGVRFEKQLIADAQCGKAPFSGGFFTMLQDYELWPRIGPEGFSKDVAAVGKLRTLVLPWCCPLDEIKVPDVKFTPLAQTSDLAFIISSPFNLMPDQDWRFLRTSSASKGPYSVAVLLAGRFPTAFPSGPPQVQAPPEGDTAKPAPPQFDPATQVKAASDTARLVVLSSATAFSDDFMRYGEQRQWDNQLFTINIVDMLLLGNELVGIRSAPAMARPLKQLSDAEKLLARWLNVLGVPVLVVLFGALLWMLRRQRRLLIQARYHG